MTETSVSLALTPEQAAALDAGGSVVHAEDPATHRRYFIIDEASRRLTIDELRGMLQEAIDQSDRGECVPWDPQEIKESIRRHLSQRPTES